MAEVLGVAASAIAVIELSAKIASLCLQYSKDVKNARDDIARIGAEVTNLKITTEGIQQLLDGPQGERLQTSQQLQIALQNSNTQVEKLKIQLDPSRRQRAMRRVGIHALKWPFKSQDIEKVVQSLMRCTQTMSISLQVDQTFILLDLDHKVVLDRLLVATGASFDSHAEEYSPQCLPGTRVDLLNETTKWVDNPEGKTIFWLNGMAGTGKSTISRTFADYCNQQNILGASFFFKRGEGDRGNALKFFTTIASQLVLKHRALISHLKNAIDNDPNVIEKAIQKQFEKLILEPLSKISQSKTINTLVILIDALDECENDADVKLLIYLFSRTKTLSLPRVRVFVTSRPELPIRLGFGKVRGTYQNLVLHDVPEQVVEHDIFTFLNHELAMIRSDYSTTVSEDRQLPLVWPDRSQVSALVDMATPLFIFAATICRFLSDRLCGDPEEQLEQVLAYQTMSQVSKLDATYLPVLNRQLRANHFDDETNRIIHEFQDIVGAIILLENPLPIYALARLVDVSKKTVDRRLDFLHSVLSVPSQVDSPVRLLHLSFRDFLLDPSKRKENPFWIDKKRSHKQLLANCIRVMNNSLRTDICDLQAPGTCTSSIDSQKISDSLQPQVQYACRYWPYPLQQASALISDDDDVYSFLHQHFLHWLEALSLIGRATESLGMVKLLQGLVQPKSARTYKFLNDASRVILAMVSIIQQASLQIYSAALVFAPKKSIIRSVFKQDIPGWISLLPNVENNWSQCLQTLEGHNDSVSSVAFSPDSKLVASGSDDSTVRIWSAETGEEQQILAGHSDYVRFVAFSPDSKLVASGSDDKTVRIWSAETGEEQQILEGHSNWVSSVAFSPDSKLIASGSGDKTVRIWSAETGEERQVLADHSDYVRSVAFSPDSKLVASGSDDSMVRIWSAETGDKQQMLAGHSDWVRSVAFSPDSKLVASGSGDKTVRIWSAETGEEQQVLAGHSDWVRSVAFSPDLKLVASGSDDSTVRIWSAETGEEQQAVNIGITTSRLSFDLKGLHLYTDVGAISLKDLRLSIKASNASTTKSSQAVSHQPLTSNNQNYQPGYSLNTSGSWIIINGKNLLWLPTNYRRSCSALFHSTVVIGTGTGKVIVMRFSV